jgi:hypothetical protein
MKWLLTNLFKRNLKPIVLDIESRDKLSGSNTRINFNVIFKVAFFWNARDMSFESKGVFETRETIDKETLTKILETTDQDSFLELNMKRRELGNFDYQYLYNNNCLIVTFKTF